MTQRPGRDEPVANDLEALQQLVAARHQVLLGHDDPILMLQTVNEHLVTKTAAALEQAQNAALIKFCHEIEVSTAAWSREVKEVGARTLVAARRISIEQIAVARQELIDTLTLERKRTTAAIHRATILNATILVAAVLCVLGALWLH